MSSKIYSKNFLTSFRYQRRLKITHRLLAPYITKKTVMLDIGCGDGTWLRYISRFIGSGFGIDAGWSNASDEWVLFPENISVAKSDFLTYPFKSNAYDMVCCFETLEHVADPQKVINIIKQCLKRGGVAAISIPIEVGLSVFMKELAALLIRYKRTIDPDRAWSFTELAKALFYDVDEIKKKRLESKNFGHKGFDYREVEKIIYENFNDVRWQGTPFRLFGKIMNVGIVYIGFKK